MHLQWENRLRGTLDVSNVNRVSELFLENMRMAALASLNTNEQRNPLVAILDKNTGHTNNADEQDEEDEITGFELHDRLWVAVAQTEPRKSQQQGKGGESSPVGNCIARLLYSTCWSACGNTPGGRKCPGAKRPKKPNKLCGEKGKDKKSNFCEKLCLMFGVKTADGMKCWCCKKKEHVHTACCCRCADNPELEEGGGGKNRNSGDSKNKTKKPKKSNDSKKAKAKKTSSSKKVETALLIPKNDEVDPTLEPIQVGACTDCDDVRYKFMKPLSSTGDEVSEIVSDVERPSTPNDQVTYPTKVAETPLVADNESITNVITKTLSTTHGGQLRIEQKIFVRDNRKSVIVVTHGETCECDLCKALKTRDDKVEDSSSPQHYILPNEARSKEMVEHPEGCKCSICLALKPSNVGDQPESGKPTALWVSHSKTKTTGSKDNETPPPAPELPPAEPEIRNPRDESPTRREKHVVFQKCKNDEATKPAQETQKVLCKKKIVKRARTQMIPKLKVEHIPIALQESSDNCPSSSEIDAPEIEPQDCDTIWKPQVVGKKPRKESPESKNVSFPAWKDDECAVEEEQETSESSSSSSDESADDQCLLQRRIIFAPGPPCDCVVCNKHIKRIRRRDKCNMCGETLSKKNKQRKKTHCGCESTPAKDERLEQPIEEISKPDTSRNQEHCVYDCSGQCRHLAADEQANNLREEQQKSFAFRAMDDNGKNRPSCWWPECCDLPSEFQSELFHVPSVEEFPLEPQSADSTLSPRGHENLALLPIWYRNICKRKRNH